MVQGYRGWQAGVRRLIGAPLIGPLVYRLNVNRPMVRLMMKEHVLADPASLTPERLAAKLEVTRRRNARFASAAFVTGGLDLVRSRDAFHDLVRRAKVPVLAVWGPQTPARSRAEMEALAGLPEVAVILLPQGALGVYEEHPAAVATATASFLAG
jgi:pimeloyl-ACP methyl ester carboxylesterase